MCVYIYIYIVCVFIHMYIYIYIYVFVCVCYSTLARRTMQAPAEPPSVTSSLLLRALHDKFLHLHASTSGYNKLTNDHTLLTYNSTSTTEERPHSDTGRCRVGARSRRALGTLALYGFHYHFNNLRFRHLQNKVVVVCS